MGLINVYGLDLKNRPSISCHSMWIAISVSNNQIICLLLINIFFVTYSIQYLEIPKGKAIFDIFWEKPLQSQIFVHWSLEW